MYNNGESPHLNKIGACYCKDVQVDYAPDGQYTTFGGAVTEGGGHPVHTKMSVTMLEDRILTKRDIEAGVNGLNILIVFHLHNITWMAKMAT